MYFGKILRLLIAFALGGFGLVTGLVTFLSVVDPVGTKMSDDADPFGDPSISVPTVIILALVSLMCLIFSGVLFNSLDKKR